MGVEQASRLPTHLVRELILELSLRAAELYERIFELSEVRHAPVAR